jgi:hypothetical protein
MEALHAVIDSEGVKSFVFNPPYTAPAATPPPAPPAPQSAAGGSGGEKALEDKGQSSSPG